MYVAVTRKKYKDTYHEQILLRESYREDGKVKTRTIANLTNKPKEQVIAITDSNSHFTPKTSPFINPSSKKTSYPNLSKKSCRIP